MVEDTILLVMVAIMLEAEEALPTKADIIKTLPAITDMVYTKRSGNVKKREMTFKAKIATPQVLRSEQGQYRTYTSPYYFQLTKARVFFPKEIDKKPFMLLRPENIFHDGDKYTLIALSKEEDDFTNDSKYQAKFSNGLTVNLIVNNWNFWKLNWIHKQTWIQKNSDFLLKESLKAIIAGSIGFLIALKGCK